MPVLAVYLRGSHLHLALEAADLQVNKKILLPQRLSPVVDEEIFRWIEKHSTNSLQVIVTSGVLANAPAGDIFAVDEKLLDAIEHSSQAAGPSLVHRLSRKFGAPAYLVDPFRDDELDDKALVSGTPQIPRRISGDAFIFKYLARQETKKRKLPFSTARFVIANLDSEFQMGAFSEGKVMDLVHSKEEGPFSCRQSGALPYDSVLDLCATLGDKEQVLRKVNEKSGLWGYLGLKDFSQLGKYQADPVVKALIYQIAKEIGAYGTVLKGKLDAILLAGELIHQTALAEKIKKRVEFLGDVVFYPGDQSLKALLAAGREILASEKPASG